MKCRSTFACREEERGGGGGGGGGGGLLLVQLHDEFMRMPFEAQRMAVAVANPTLRGVCCCKCGCRHHDDEKSSKNWHRGTTIRV